MRPSVDGLPSVPRSDPVIFGFDFRPLAPEARRLMWHLRAKGGAAVIYRFPNRDYVRRLGACLRDRGFARFTGGGNARLELTARGNAYLDKLMRAH